MGRERNGSNENGRYKYKTLEVISKVYISLDVRWMGVQITVYISMVIQNSYILKYLTL